MTTEAAAPTTAYCSACGRPSPVVSRGIDPRYPIVRCYYLDAAGKDHGHGTIAGELTPDRIEAVLHAKHVERVTAHHRAHVEYGRRHDDCRECGIDPPAPRVTPHPYSDVFTTKYRIAAHLDHAHADRQMLVNLAGRSRAELAAHHQQLHNRAVGS